MKRNSPWNIKSPSCAQYRRNVYDSHYYPPVQHVNNNHVNNTLGMQHISLDIATYKTTSLPLSPRNINNDKSNDFPQEPKSSADQYDEYYTDNIGSMMYLLYYTSFPDNPQGSRRLGRDNYQIQSENPLGIS